MKTAIFNFIFRLGLTQHFLFSQVFNDRPSDNGTLIPQSTLIIHVPVILDSQEGPRPLLVPTEILSQGRINCTHFNAIPTVPAEVWL